MNTHHILIVEDESIIANDIRKTLKRLGYAVSGIVSSGRAALEAVTRNRTDLVLMDIKLKGDMDGIETAHHLEKEYKIPVVFLSGHSNPELLRRAGQAAPFGYIVKPFEERTLQATLEMALYRNQMEIERRSLEAKQERLNAELAESEAKLHKMVESLLHSNQELEQFSSIASHDLKSPLFNIISYSKILEEEYADLGEEGKTHVQMIRKSANRMTKIINDLLDFAKMSHIPKAFQEIDLNAMISAVCNDIQGSIKEKKAIVEIGELPRLRGEPVQLQHVFQNLIENALQYSSVGDQVPLIRIDGHVDNDYAEIHVRDNGIGFDEKYAEEIFLPFKRLSTKHKGTGIGLAICKKIVENHGGRITATSRMNQGSDFIVRLSM